MTANSAEVHLHAPIEPGHGLGGILVGASLQTVANLLQRAYLQGTLRTRILNIFEASYSLPGADIGVDVRNGKIYRVTAKPGYFGRLFGRIEIGMNVGRAMLLAPHLFYDEPREVLLCAGIPGVALEVSAVDPDPADVPGLTIVGVSVFTPDVETVLGQLGQW